MPDTASCASGCGTSATRNNPGFSSMTTARVPTGAWMRRLPSQRPDPAAGAEPVGAVVVLEQRLDRQAGGEVEQLPRLAALFSLTVYATHGCMVPVREERWPPRRRMPNQ